VKTVEYIETFMHEGGTDGKLLLKLYEAEKIEKREPRK
jgi:hypothetical protein